jgi:hypothetical protein
MVFRGNMADHSIDKSNQTKKAQMNKVIWGFILGFTPLLTLVFYLIRMFWKTSLIFEQIILSGILVAIIFLLILIYMQYFNVILILLVFLIATATTQAFTNVVLNVDRSRSFYILSWVRFEKIELVNGTLNLEKVYSSEKLNSRAIEQRLDEQISRGLVSNNGNFKLTFRGKITVHFSDFIGNKFSLNGWEMNNH